MEPGHSAHHQVCPQIAASGCPSGPGEGPRRPRHLSTSSPYFRSYAQAFESLFWDLHCRLLDDQSWEGGPWLPGRCSVIGLHRNRSCKIGETAGTGMNRRCWTKWMALHEVRQTVLLLLPFAECIGGLRVCRHESGDVGTSKSWERDGTLLYLNPCIAMVRTWCKSCECSFRTLWKSYLFNCLTKDEKLEWLNTRGRIVFANSFVSYIAFRLFRSWTGPLVRTLIVKRSFSSPQHMTEVCVGSSSKLNKLKRKYSDRSTNNNEDITINTCKASWQNL